LQWSEVDFETKTLNLPASRCKNGRSHQVPLSAEAVIILEGMDRDGPSVFEPQSFSKMKSELDKLLPPGMEPWVLHDLRRSAASGLAALGVQLPVIEKVLNHQSGSFRGVCGVYQRHSYSSEKRAALDLWGEHVAQLSLCPVVMTKAAA
jgi:integrase